MTWRRCLLLWLCVIRILVGSLCLGVETAYNVPVTPRNTIFLSEGYYYMSCDTDTPYCLRGTYHSHHTVWITGHRSTVAFQETPIATALRRWTAGDVDMDTVPTHSSQQIVNPACQASYNRTPDRLASIHKRVWRISSRATSLRDEPLKPLGGYSTSIGATVSPSSVSVTASTLPHSQLTRLCCVSASSHLPQPHCTWIVVAADSGSASDCGCSVPILVPLTVHRDETMRLSTKLLMSPEPRAETSIANASESRSHLLEALA